MVRAEVVRPDGSLLTREIVLDQPETAHQIANLFQHERVVTLHSEEATLEDIFIQLTGRALV